MSSYKERRFRKLQPVIETDTINHMIKNYMVGKTFFIKNSFPAILVKVIQFDPKKGITVESDLELTEQVIIYKVFNKYMEASCTVENTAEPNRYLLSVKAFNIALSTREYERFAVTQKEVTINNIRSARNTINASLFNIPTSVKVHFSQYEQKLRHLADEVAIKVFDKSDDKLELIRKSGKALWLKDTQEVMSYMPEMTEAFIDYREHLATEIGTVMDEYRRAKIKSEVFVPIIYIGHDGNSISLGYIHLRSKSKLFDIDFVLEVKALAFEMIDRIRESNTVLINKRQEVANISRGGLQLKITDGELKKTLVHQKGISLDVIFKLQQPITVRTEIIYTADMPTGDLVIGVQITGSSSRGGELERFAKSIANLNSIT